MEAALLNDASPALPWYRPVHDELRVFEEAWRARLPVMLKGPTGCGKSRLVEHMAARLGRPRVTVACHDDTSAVDLVGRYLVQGGDTVWQDGPVTRAVREGAILYLDEEAGEGFMLVVSWNPGYQRSLKELKPSTRQRFVGLSFGYPRAKVEQEVLIGETRVDPAVARRLVALAGRIRGAEALGLTEAPSTRLLVHAARLMASGLPPRLACESALVEPLTDDPEVGGALRDLVALVF